MEQEITKGINPNELTEQERTYVELKCEDLTQQQIADKMFRSLKAIQGYAAKSKVKIKHKTSAGLVVYAIRNGLFDPFKTTEGIINKTDSSPHDKLPDNCKGRLLTLKEFCRQSNMPPVILIDWLKSYRPPTTLKEFRKLHGLSKKELLAWFNNLNRFHYFSIKNCRRSKSLNKNQLVKWLNENYKK